MERDRRDYPRKRVLCRVDYADRKGRAGMGMIKDISSEGMFVEYTPGLAVGETVVTTFSLPDSPPFKLKARVMRTARAGAGLQFVGPEQGSQFPESLEGYCAALLQTWLGHA